MKAKFKFADELNNSFKLKIRLRYIFKKYLLNSKLLACYPDNECYFGKKRKEQAFFLHFAEYLLAYSRETTRRQSILKVKYGTREVIWHNGLLLGKKDSKKILYIKAPCNFNDATSYYSVFESQELIKDFIPDFENRGRLFLVDEVGYIKHLKWSKLFSDSSFDRLEVARDWYVDKSFVGGRPFTLSNGMLYYDFNGVLLQPKGSSSEDLNAVYQLDTFEGMVPATCPLVSNNTIIFIAKTDPNSTINKLGARPL